MSKHRAPRKRYYLWQYIRLMQYKLQLFKLWFTEQRADLPDIIKQIRNK